MNAWWALVLYFCPCGWRKHSMYIKAKCSSQTYTAHSMNHYAQPLKPYARREWEKLSTNEKPFHGLRERERERNASVNPAGSALIFCNIASWKMWFPAHKKSECAADLGDFLIDINFQEGRWKAVWKSNAALWKFSGECVCIYNSWS
jgi:hypothetical protein